VPIYDYVCASCRQKTEVIHGIDAPGPRFCPACGAEGTLRKALTTPAVHFKGSGWAKKDRSTSGSSRTRAGAASEGSGDGSTKAAEQAAASSTGSDGGTGSGNGSGAGGERAGGGGSRGKDKTTTKGAGNTARTEEG
jgi:putative FmdB family regulatory protein